MAKGSEAIGAATFAKRRIACRSPWKPSMTRWSLRDSAFLPIIVPRIRTAARSPAMHQTAIDRMPPRDTTSVERRQDERRWITLRTRVAYLRGGALPSDRNLVEVQCHNISRSGFAYWVLGAPEHDELVVVFGEGPTSVRMLAGVVHVTVAEHNGRLRTLVGCQFNGGT